MQLDGGKEVKTMFEKKYGFLFSRFQPVFEAEGGAAGGGAAGDGNSGNNDGDGAAKGDDGKAKGEGGKTKTPEPKSFDDLLKEGYQSEFDKRITKAVNTALENERNRQQIITDDLKDEVLRVSKMTDAEKDAYFKAKTEKEAAKKEAELTRRELTLDARTQLKDKGLPDSFVDLLNYSDAEACTKSIETLQTAFSEAVQAAVNERLKGTQPPKDAGTEGDNKTAEEQEAERIKQQIYKAARIKV